MFHFMKTKIGFTLVELLVILLVMATILAIGIPSYQNVTKATHEKVCRVERSTVLSMAREWCTNNNFNDNYVFVISSDGTKGTVTEPSDDASIELLTNEVLGGKVPHCPSKGTYRVVLTKTIGSLVKIEVTCDGGKYPDTHNK